MTQPEEDSPNQSKENSKNEKDQADIGKHCSGYFRVTQVIGEGIKIRTLKAN
jgi:hypothetical protein